MFAADICGILVFAADICGILMYAAEIKMPQTTEAYSFDWGILSMPQISVANTSMPQIFVAYTSMTRVSPFENGRNEKIMSSLQLDFVDLQNINIK